MKKALIAALALGASGRAYAQALRPIPAPIVARTLPRDTITTPLYRQKWARPLGSLLVPGSGQLMAGQSRGLVYLAAELFLVSRAIASSRRGRDGASQFRTLAFDVARSQFTATRVDGPWDYYETMEKFVESGVYDVSGGRGPFTPESDSTTFNGSVWALARRTYFTDPAVTPPPLSAPYQAALTFYKAHAVQDQFRWSWRGARLEQDVYRSEILASDDAFRSRTNYLGVLVLNHLASAIDALISLRLGGGRGALPKVTVDPATDGVTLTWSGHLQFH